MVTRLVPLRAASAAWLSDCRRRASRICLRTRLYLM